MTVSMQAAQFRLDPRRIDASLLPDIALVEWRIEIARLIARDLVQHPPRRSPTTGRLVLDPKLYTRISGEVIGQRDGQPVTIKNALAVSAASEHVAHVTRELLAAIDARQELAERLAAFDSLAAFFPQTREDLERESRELHARAEEGHRRIATADAVRDHVA